MLLRDNNLQEPIKWIIDRDGERSFNHLHIIRKTCKSDDFECSVCGRPVKNGDKAFFLTNAADELIFDDAFDTPNCALEARDWLKYLLKCYISYVVTNNCLKMTEDDFSKLSQTTVSLKDFRAYSKNPRG